MQTILVCDDDRQIVEAIEIYLNGEGYRILKAYDGQEALDLLKDNEVNLMILDVMMPGLDGLRTTMKVRETSSIPIIILSAKSEDTDPGTEHRGGRLYHETFQSPGAGGQSKVSASPLHPAGKSGRLGEHPCVPLRRSGNQ